MAQAALNLVLTSALNPKITLTVAKKIVAKQGVPAVTVHAVVADFSTTNPTDTIAQVTTFAAASMAAASAAYQVIEENLLALETRPAIEANRQKSLRDSTQQFIRQRRCLPLAKSCSKPVVFD